MSNQEICPRCGVPREQGEECLVCAAIGALSDPPRSAQKSTTQSTEADTSPRKTPPGPTARSVRPGPTLRQPRTRPDKGVELHQRLQSASWPPGESSGRSEEEKVPGKENMRGQLAGKLRNKRNIAILAAILLLCAGLGGWWIWQSGQVRDRPGLEPMALPEHEHAIAAHYHCKELVQAGLENPYSARFPPTDYESRRQDDGSYVVTSFVDEELTSGQRQRRNWRCQTRYTGDAAQASMDELYMEKNWAEIRLGVEVVRPN